VELVHTDLIGKLETSYLGYNYYDTFLNDYAHKVWVFFFFFLKKKKKKCFFFFLLKKKKKK